MKPGARSIRGAMGTYFWVSVAALVATALWLWSGSDAPPAGPTVSLAADGPWIGATLDGGRGVVELRAGEERAVPPAAYRVTLLPASGEARRFTLDLSADAAGAPAAIELGAASRP